MSTLIIAEAGVNHNGDEKLAFELIDAAYCAGADIIKFQTFKASELATSQAAKASYQKSKTQADESQLDMLRQLELSQDAFIRLKEYCKKIGIGFLSTAFDFSSLTFLTDKLELQQLKIPSGEITNAPFILAHAHTKQRLILSTGMSSLDEVKAALAVICFGYLNDQYSKPSKLDFLDAYASLEGQSLLKERVTLLHCTTQYPAPLNDINLKAMDTMNSAFGLQLGYSDHSEGILVPIAAVARGACLIEKHFTLNKEMEGPDHCASLEPDEFAEMVKAIRDTEKILGDGIKEARPSEISNKTIARKSLVTKVDMKSGEIFSEDNMAIMRPGSGMSPYLYWSLIDQAAKKEYKKGDLIDE